MVTVRQLGTDHKHPESTHFLLLLYHSVTDHRVIFLPCNATPVNHYLWPRVCLYTTRWSLIDKAKWIELLFTTEEKNIWNSLPNSVVDVCTVNAFKASLDKFWQHQLVKFDFTADLTGTGNRSEEVIKWYCSFMIVYNYDADLEVSDTCVRNSLLSWGFLWLNTYCVISIFEYLQK